MLIIPAAGSGSRLNTSTPKLLVPVNGRAMIDHLLDLYRLYVDSFVLVVHPSTEAAVRQHCAAADLPIDFAVQPEPTGMLDAILIPRMRVARQDPRHVWITWCDQIAIHPRTVEKLAVLGTEQPEAHLIFPTAWRPEPYVHLARDGDGQIVAVLHRREGDDLPEVGESEAGLFSLSDRAYFEMLPEFAQSVEEGVATRERNFVPFVAWASGRAQVRTFPCRDAIETVGINTPEELRQVGEYLKNRDQ